MGKREVPLKMRGMDDRGGRRRKKIVLGDQSPIPSRIRWGTRDLESHRFASSHN